MSRARRAPRKRRGLWGLLSKLFGKPQGRHVRGTPPPPPTNRAEPGPAELVFAATEAQVEEVASVVAEVAPVPSEAAVHTVTPHAEVLPTAPFEPTAVRLIFVDGSVLPLPEGSAEERQAQYLARRVLDAARRHAG
jgi:hypothetical protein